MSELKEGLKTVYMHRTVARKLKNLVNHLDVSKYPDVCQISKTSVSHIKFFQLSSGTFSFCKYKLHVSLV